VIDPLVQAQFGAGLGYLNTASVGVPPNVGVDAMLGAIEDWRSGNADPPSYDAYVERARAAFAKLAEVHADRVAIGSTASAFAGLVASQLPSGSEVLTAEGDFTSVLFPFMAQKVRGVRFRHVELERLADEVNERTTLVAVSSVQSVDGRIADLDALVEACARVGAHTMIDATQSYGWLPLDASRFDYVVCHAYKWLPCARGVAFLAVSPERRAALIPHNAGWYSGADIWNSIYGAPLRLAENAHGLDISPAWLSWVGAAPTLELFVRVGQGEIHSHNVGLANQLRAGLGQEPGHSAIVRIEQPGASDALSAAGVRCANRAGAVRLSFHLYNDVADVELALEALGA
jgi:selenocysteine lyase/cysteine desulfurase